jgi:DNA-binding response OmpR family regulator
MEAGTLKHAWGQLCITGIQSTRCRRRPSGKSSLKSPNRLRMSDDGPIRRIVRFGVFEMDLEQRELRRSGLKVKLQDQPFQLLAVLLKRAGALVTREQLRMLVEKFR